MRTKIFMMIVIAAVFAFSSCKKDSNEGANEDAVSILLMMMLLQKSFTTMYSILQIMLQSFSTRPGVQKQNQEQFLLIPVLR
jgi:hypothetical protein